MKINGKLRSLIALLAAVCVLFTLGACGGRTDTGETTEPEASPEDLLEDFIDANYSAVEALNEQYGEIYECCMYAEGLDLVYEFRMMIDTDAESFGNSLKNGSNENFVNLRDALSEYTGNPDACVIVRLVDTQYHVIYETRITKDTEPVEAEEVSVQYGTLGELLGSAAFKTQIAAQNTADLRVLTEADGDETLVIRYQLQDTYSADEIEELKPKQQDLLNGDSITESMASTFAGVNALLTKEITGIRVTVEDLSGAVMAERTFTAADFAE